MQNWRQFSINHASIAVNMASAPRFQGMESDSQGYLGPELPWKHLGPGESPQVGNLSLRTGFKHVSPELAPGGTGASALSIPLLLQLQISYTFHLIQ